MPIILLDVAAKADLKRNVGAVKTGMGWVGFLWRRGKLIVNSSFVDSILAALTAIDESTGFGDTDRKAPRWIEDFFIFYADGKAKRAATILEKKAGFDFEGATPHQIKVWTELTKIPFGETRSYGEIAKIVGSSPRAVGGACARNRCSIIIPCHRVIGADGKLVGFGGGLEMKRMLIEYEKAALGK